MNSSTYCVVQLNRNLLVSDQLLDYSRANGVEDLLLQEVPTLGDRLIGFDAIVILSCREGSARTAIVVLHKDIEVVALQGLSVRSFAVASLRKRLGQVVVFVSAYFKYSIQTHIFTDRLGYILDRIDYDVVIGADVNAHSTQWFSRPGNNSGSVRATHVESLIAEKHLTVHKQLGCLDTYERRGMGTSNIDVTLTRGDSLTNSVSEWYVLDIIDKVAPIFEFKIFGREKPEVSEAEVKRAIWRMATNKAPGLDGITTGVLRKAWGVIGTPLTRVLNECLRRSVFPDCWKTNVVMVITLISKGEDRDLSPKSYRPVSLLSAQSKVLERLVVDRLEEETEGALSEEQHGFQVGKSTISAIRSCMHWVNNCDEIVVGIFLDISGSFDNLRWNILIRDMMALGASDATRSIIQGYLTGRRAVLSVEGATAFADLTKGCPHGLQLGPSLWNLSMDRALITNNDDRVKLVTYADDLAVFISSSELLDIQGREA